uniref:DUF6533 domain-containing protein n=1 Tax=Psilocybe cubensis TaxID=181762 RepID=A0A8H7XQE0_PSICU
MITPTTTSPLSGLINELINGLQLIQFFKYAEVSATSVILYDYLLTLDQEITFLWTKRFSFTKLLFFVNRYYFVAASSTTPSIAVYGLFVQNPDDTLYIFQLCPFTKTISLDNPGLPFVNSCQRYIIWQIVSWIVLAIITQGILQVRLYALYGNSKKLLAFTLTFHFLSLAASSAIIAVATSKELADHGIGAIAIPGNRFCGILNATRVTYVYWIPSLAFEFCLCALAIAKGFSHFKGYDGSYFSTGMRLVDILVGDSLLYFLVITLVYVACVAVWVAEVQRINAPLAFELSISTTLCSRIIFKLYGALDETEVLSELKTSQT